MEFLLTYGWAIVVVVTAISGLAYFGILDMDKFAREMCTIDAGLSTATRVKLKNLTRIVR